MARFSLILKQFNNIYSYFLVELFLLVIMVASVGTNITLRASAATPQKQDRGLLFVYLQNHRSLNPKLVENYETVNLLLSNDTNLVKQVLATSVRGKDEIMASGTATAPAMPTMSGTAMLKPNPSTNELAMPKKDVEIYKVKGGDTVAAIASNYGLAVSTIIWENNLSSAGVIKPEQELRIPPADGISYTIRNGNTLDAIAKTYKVDTESILQFNDIENPEFIQPGDIIFIPDATKITPPTPTQQQHIAQLNTNNYKEIQVPGDYQGTGDEFTWPLPGAVRLSQSFTKRHPGIDIPCNGCNVVAADDGIVELAGWQKSYGYTIVINHGSGRKTRYGHASNLLVSAGDQVVKGQIIMISGSTGRSTGPHLHFELLINGVRVNPLKYVTK